MLAVVVLLAGLLVLYQGPLIPEGKPGLQEYGQRMEGYGSANWSWGRYPGTRFAIAVDVTEARTLDAIVICWKRAKGYGAGTCGKWRCEVRGDTAETHLPSEEVLATTDTLTGPPDGYWHIDIPNLPLRKNARYHLVMYNTDPQPDANWSSPNTIMSAPETGWYPGRTSAFYQEKWDRWGSRDNPRGAGEGGMAAFLMKFTDGTCAGQPYYSAKIRYVYGALAEGEVFTWTRPNFAVHRLGFCVSRVGQPPGELRAVLETLDGAVQYTATVASAKECGTAPGWRYLPLDTPVTLQHGKAYRLYLEAPACRDEKHCYAVSIPYSTEQVPGWPELTWGGTAAYSVYREDGWHPAPVPADLTFSLQGVEVKSTENGRDL